MKKHFNKINNKWYEVNHKGEYTLVSDEQLINNLEINLILQEKKQAGEKILENVSVADSTIEFIKKLRRIKFIKELENQGINL